MERVLSIKKFSIYRKSMGGFDTKKACLLSKKDLCEGLLFLEDHILFIGLGRSSIHSSPVEVFDLKRLVEVFYNRRNVEGLPSTEDLFEVSHL